MSATRRHEIHRVPVWGVLLLFSGIVLLLQVVNVLPWTLWNNLWKFWPVIFILIGISLLARRFIWLGTLAAMGILGICLWISVIQASPSLSNDVWHVEQRYNFPASGIQTAEVRVNFPKTGNLFIGALEAGSENLVEVDDSSNAKYARDTQGQSDSMAANFNKDGDVGKLSIAPVNQNLWEKWHVAWMIEFNREIPAAFEIESKVAYTGLDLTDLNITSVTITMDVASGYLKLPAITGMANIDIDMNLSNLDVTVPQGVAAKIRVNPSLSYFSIDESRFVKEGEYYVSPGYDAAENRITLNISCDLGKITIK